MITELSIPGAFVFTPKQFGDERGVFLEWFKGEVFEDAAGHSLDLRQANLSVSAVGVLRGIHFADVPPGQAKYVTCTKGSLFDVVVDVRVGSPTFGQWDAVMLDDVDRRSIYLAEGLGHAFLSLEDGSTAVYMCSTGYNPAGEHGVHPLDQDIGIDWPKLGRNGSSIEFELSTKDAEAPGLSEAATLGLLPAYNDTTVYIDSFRA